MTPSDRREWTRRITEMLQRLGGERWPTYWLFETIAGRLEVMIKPLDDHLVVGLGTVRLNFSDVKRARERINCSLIRGTLDLWYFGGWTIETAVDHLDRQLKKVCAFRIRVFQDGSDETVDYTILADTETDARVMAFCLDGGHAGQTVERGHIELAKTYTEVL